jgi:hypothetical protein
VVIAAAVMAAATVGNSTYPSKSKNMSRHIYMAAHVLSSNGIQQRYFPYFYCAFFPVVL